MYVRNISPALLAALTDTPVVLLNGARQTGKSTLVQTLTATEHPAIYLTLDDAGVLAAARTDPAGFIGDLEGQVVIDEIQRAPELFPAIKVEVDRRRQPGRFLLTGSANVLLLPHLSESLAGRIELLTLWPLSQGEIDGVCEGFIDAIFAKTLPVLKDDARKTRALVDRLMHGGYPEVLTRNEPSRRKAWFGAYITAILQRDVRDLAHIEGLTEFPRLLSLLATRVATLLNYAELSRALAMPQTTLKRYMALLETTFLIQTLPTWSSNLGKRLVKASKIMLNDTGLIAYLLGLDSEHLKTRPETTGPLLENFVVMELRKQTAWNKIQPQLFHFRTQSGQEVDVILENDAGRLVGIEIKASATVGAQDFKGLHALAEITGKRFQRGIVLYTGRTSIPFGRNMYALPISALWRLGAKPSSRKGG